MSDENEEPRETRTFTVRLPDDLHLALKIHAHRTKRDMGDVTIEALRALLATKAAPLPSTEEVKP